MKRTLHLSLNQLKRDYLDSLRYSYFQNFHPEDAMFLSVNFEPPRSLSGLLGFIRSAVKSAMDNGSVRVVLINKKQERTTFVLVERPLFKIAA